MAAFTSFGLRPSKTITSSASLHNGTSVAKRSISMNVSLFQAAAALNANSRWQESIAQNLASSSIPGFKKQDLSFSAIQAGMMPVNPSSSPDSAYFLLPKASVSTNFQAGQLKRTDVNTDV